MITNLRIYKYKCRNIEYLHTTTLQYKRQPPVRVLKSVGLSTLSFSNCHFVPPPFGKHSHDDSCHLFVRLGHSYGDDSMRQQGLFTPPKKWCKTCWISSIKHMQFDLETSDMRSIPASPTFPLFVSSIWRQLSEWWQHTQGDLEAFWVDGQL